MVEATIEQWETLWRRMNAKGDPSEIWLQLATRYCEPHRAYHNLHHIGHCLAEFAPISNLTTTPKSVEAAIWFHDVVYDTHAHDNEEQSAAFAVGVLTQAGLDHTFVRTVKHLILATKHVGVISDPDAAMLVDIDLAILGAPRDHFARFERQIREEYSWVSKTDFVAGRTKILRQFFDRPKIYQTESFRLRYEDTARANISWAINQLKNSGTDFSS